MKKHKREELVPTLGAYVSKLHPGSACICCGASLQQADAPRPNPSAEGLASSSDEACVLVCPDCGSEVGSLLSEEAAPGASRTLNRAA